MKIENADNLLQNIFNEYYEKKPSNGEIKTIIEYMVKKNKESLEETITTLQNKNEYYIKIHYDNDLIYYMKNRNFIFNLILYIILNFYNIKFIEFILDKYDNLLLGHNIDKKIEYNFNRNYYIESIFTHAAYRQDKSENKNVKEKIKLTNLIFRRYINLFDSDFIFKNINTIFVLNIREYTILRYLLKIYILKSSMENKNISKDKHILTFLKVLSICPYNNHYKTTFKYLINIL